MWHRRQIIAAGIDYTVKGLHTPVIREIYDPILNELSDLGVAFHVEERKLGEPEAVLK